MRTPNSGSRSRRSSASTRGADARARLRRGRVSLHLAVGRSVYLELNARLQFQAMQLGGGKVTYLDPGEAKSSPQDYERSWDFWKARLPVRK